MLTITKIFIAALLALWVVLFLVASLLQPKPAPAFECAAAPGVPNPENKIDFERQGAWGKLADAVLWPGMKALSGWGEAPQRTHFYNNQKFDEAALSRLSRDAMVYCGGIPSEVRRSGLLDVRFHLGKLGGWQNYIVFEPVDHEEEWFIGWAGENDGGVSVTPLSGRVRMLVGPDPVWFYGTDGEGKQISIKMIGAGVLGDDGPYGQVSLR